MHKNYEVFHFLSATVFISLYFNVNSFIILVTLSSYTSAFMDICTVYL